jgi:hypothetical protein
LYAISVKIETITGGLIGNTSIYPWATDPIKTDILKISKADWRDNQELCGTAFIKAMRGLPAGVYTLVQQDSGYVVDFVVGKRGGLRLRPYDGKTINTTHQRPCLRIEVKAHLRSPPAQR